MTTGLAVLLFVVAGAIVLWVVAPKLLGKKADAGQPSALDDFSKHAAALRARFEADLKTLQERAAARRANGDPLATLMTFYQQVRTNLLQLAPAAVENPEVKEALKVLEQAAVAVATAIIKYVPPAPLP